MIGRIPRRLALLAIATVLLAGSAGPTTAWSNGPSDGNGYGTHDWIIDQALKVLDGRADGWFDAGAARLKSDDPDTIEVAADASREIEHVYREAGTPGGAVDRIAKLYADAVAHYDEGDYHAASEDLGMLAHFYGDILNPYHSARAGVGKESHHRWYEVIVDDLTGKASDKPSWSSASRSVSTISNVRSSAIAAAAYSRKYFDRIHASIVANHTKLNTSADDATGTIFKYGAKGLADIIYSVSRGVGEAPLAATLSTKVKWVGVAKGEPFQAVYVTARDAAGKPIPGLGVEVHRPTPTGGTTTKTVYTDANGTAKANWSVGSTPLFTKRTVNVEANAKTGSAWYIVSPKLRTGTTGFKTWMADRTVKVGQLARVRALARDKQGRPVPGLKVTWSWKIGAKTIVTSAITNARGRATSTYLVTTKTSTKRITISAATQSGSLNRHSATSFYRR